MMPRTSTRLTLSTLVLGALLLSSCGSDSDSTSSSSDGQASPKVETIKTGTLQCAMSGEYRPFNFYGEDTKLQGFDVDICNSIADHLGLKAEPVTGAFNTLVAGLQAKRFDTIIGSMANTPERAKAVEFSEPYYVTGAQLFVGTDSTVTEIGGLSDATVGVALGTTFEKFAQDQKNISDVKTYKADIEALKDLESGRLDGVITQGLAGRYLIKNADLKVKPVGDRLYDDIASIPVTKGNTALLDGINQALAAIKGDGSYAKISTKWFGEDISQTTS